MSRARRPWAKMSPGEKLEAVRPLEAEGLANSTIAWKLGAPAAEIKRITPLIRSESREPKSSDETRSADPTSSPDERETPAGAADPAGNNSQPLPAPLKPWSKMNAAEKQAAVLPLYQHGLTYPVIVQKLGATSTNAIAGVVDRLRKAGKLVGITKAAAAKRSKAIAPKAAPAAKPKPTGPIGYNAMVRKQERALNTAPVILINRESAFDPIPGTTPVRYGSPGCKWPVDGVHGSGLLACGQPRDFSKREDEPYCRSHARIAYAPPTTRTRRNIRDTVLEVA